MGLLVSTEIVRFLEEKDPIGVGLALMVRLPSVASVVMAITGSTSRFMSTFSLSVSVALLVLMLKNRELETRVTRNMTRDKDNTVPARLSCLWPLRFRLVEGTPPPNGDLVVSFCLVMGLC